MYWKWYFASAVFVILTAAKLLFPELTEDYRRQVVSFIEWDMDYRGAISAVGSLLSYEPLQEVFERFGVDRTYETTNMDQKEEVEEPIQSVEDLVQPEENVNTLQLGGDDTMDDVELFLLSQEAYVGYDIPDNVSFNRLTLPFDFIAPVSGITSSGFGYRIHPIDEAISFHYGTDFAVEEGTRVRCFADGQVTSVYEEPGYGKYVIVTHSDGWKTLYAHCSEIKTTVGQYVGYGEEIALSGQTGKVTGPHLHFELMHDGYYTNPEFFF